MTKANSAIKQAYIARDSAVIAQRIAKLLERLVARGVYDPEADLLKVAITIRILVAHPLLGPPAWSQLAEPEEGYASWIDHVVDMLDRQLRPQRGPFAAGRPV
jgi:hypothetical protein